MQTGVAVSEITHEKSPSEWRIVFQLLLEAAAPNDENA